MTRAFICTAIIKGVRHPELVSGSGHLLLSGGTKATQEKFGAGMR
jgi:hypothetical protein